MNKNKSCCGGNNIDEAKKLINNMNKKQSKEKNRSNSIRDKKIKKGIYFAIFLLGVVGLIFSFSGGQEVSAGDGVLSLPEEVYDAGTVSVEGGLVQHTYEIKNVGIGDLKISNIKTSCGCTSAILKVGEETSPRFGMHNNPLIWSEKVPAGGTGLLEVAFDPKFHGSKPVGSVIRSVYFNTNDSNNFEGEVRLSVNVVR